MLGCRSSHRKDHMAGPSLTTFGLQPDKPARLIGQCSEFAEQQHAGMRILVGAEDLRSLENGNVLRYTVFDSDQCMLRKRTGAVSDVDLYHLSWLSSDSWSGFAGRAGFKRTLDSRKQLGAGIYEKTPANMRLCLTSPRTSSPVRSCQHFTEPTNSLNH